MRILQIVDSFGTAGGLERFVYDFSRDVQRRGEETIIACLDAKEDEHWGDRSVDWIVLGDSTEEWIAWAEGYCPDRVIWHGGHRTALQVKALAKFFPISATVHGVTCPSGTRLFRDLDEVCTRTSGVACLGLWYARQCGTNKSPWSAIEHLQRHRAVMTTLQSCERVYGVSQFVCKKLLVEGIAKERLRVFDNTLGKLEAMPPVLSRHEDGPLRVLFVGRLVYEKGVQYLLRAIQKVADSGVPIICTIVGEGWYKDQLEALSTELGLSSRVQFIGRIAGHTVTDYYAQADVVVVPSIWPDPAPLVVPEARSKGKPVIVTDVGGIAEWADGMDHVLVAQAADAESLAQRIQEVREAIHRGSYPDSMLRVLATHRRVSLFEDVITMSKEVAQGGCL